MPFDITQALCGIHGDASQPGPPGVLSVPASQTEDSGFLSFSGLKYSPQLLRGQETHRDREWATDFPAQVMGKGQWSRVFVGLSTTVVFNPAQWDSGSCTEG